MKSSEKKASHPLPYTDVNLRPVIPCPVLSAQSRHAVPVSFRRPLSSSKPQNPRPPPSKRPASINLSISVLRKQEWRVFSAPGLSVSIRRYAGGSHLLVLQVRVPETVVRLLGTGKRVWVFHNEGTFF